MINYNTLIREIAEILRRVVGEVVELELRLSSDLGNVRIDPTQFQQVLLNLCFNARDAMPGGGKLCIRTYNHVPHQPPRRHRIQNRYRPCRSPTAAKAFRCSAPHIFEPFFTTKPRRHRTRLATVSSIITEHEFTYGEKMRPAGHDV